MTEQELTMIDWENNPPRDTNGDGSLDFAVIRGDALIGEFDKTFASTSSGEVLVEVTQTNSYGEIYLTTVERDADGNNIPGTLKQQKIWGQQLGEDVAGVFTPFLTSAFLGDNDSVFANVAANTVIGTVMDNLGETVGAFIHRSLIDEGQNFSIMAHIEEIAEMSFQDFGGEVVVNGTGAVISVVNQLIMAEVFEFTDVDGIPGAIFQGVISTGVNNILTESAGVLLGTPAMQDLFVAVGLSDESINTINNFVTSSDGLEFSHIDISSIVITAILNEVLPPIETTEGQVASSLTTVALNFLGTFSGSLAGPIGLVVGWLENYLMLFLQWLQSDLILKRVSIQSWTAIHATAAMQIWRLNWRKPMLTD